MVAITRYFVYISVAESLGIIFNHFYSVRCGSTSQSHLNPTQSALFNCSLIETIGWRRLRSWSRYVYVG